MVLLLFLALQERDTFLPSVPVTFSFSLTTEPGMTGGTMRESSEVELFMGFSEKVVEDSTVCGAGRGGGASGECPCRVGVLGFYSNGQDIRVNEREQL